MYDSILKKRLFIGLAIAAIMVQMEDWEKSLGRQRIPIYGMQRLYLRRDDFRLAKTGTGCDKPESAMPDFLG